MLIPIFFLFFFFLLLSAFFSSSETAFLSSSPYKLEYLARTGSNRAKLVQSLIENIDHILATILIGNTLVNTAAASLATFIFVSLVPDKNQAIFFSTVVTTFLILVFSEITPKTYAAYNPVKLSLFFARPLRIFVILFFPFVHVFTFISRLFFPSHKKAKGTTRSLDEEEIRGLFSGMEGISSLKKKMISGALDIGSRPVREVMIPRPQIKAIDIESSLDQVLQLIYDTGFSRFPVFKNRLDNIQGLFHAKDIIPYLTGSEMFSLAAVLRKPIFLPEYASLEKALLKMQEETIHLVFVVDEFGNMDGIVTLEDIIEEIVGEIQDEYDGQLEQLFNRISEDEFLIKGNTPVKLVNNEAPFELPERPGYTTLAGFFLDEYGRIPKAGDELVFRDIRLVIEKMTKRRINLIRIVIVPDASGGPNGRPGQE